MKKLIVIIFCVISPFLAACDQGESKSSETTKPDAESIRKSKIVVMGIDDTGSYKYFEDGKSLACKVVSQLEEGDVLYLRLISQESYTDSCSVFRLQLPTQIRNDDNNPFDRTKRRSIKQFKYNLKLIKAKAIKRIMGLKPGNAKKTDIFGFLTVASEKFKRINNGATKIVILISDLRDNQKYKAKIDLSHSKVIVLGFQVDKDPEKTQELKEKWKIKFEKLGAESTIFNRLEEEFNLRGY